MISFTWDVQSKQIPVDRKKYICGHQELGLVEVEGEWTVSGCWCLFE